MSLREQIEKFVADYLAAELEGKNLQKLAIKTIEDIVKDLVYQAIKGYFRIERSFGEYRLHKDSPLYEIVKEWYRAHSDDITKHVKNFEIPDEFARVVKQAAIREAFEVYREQFAASIRSRARVTAAYHARTILSNISSEVDEAEIWRKADKLLLKNVGDLISENDNAVLCDPINDFGFCGNDQIENYIDGFFRKKDQ